MKYRFLVLFFVIALLPSGLWAKLSDLERDKIIGNIVKNTLENSHFRKQKIDNTLSRKAFDEYLKRIDYGKQFLIKSDVDELEKFKNDMDDEIQSGEYKLVKKSNELIKKRADFVENFRKEFFKNKNLSFDDKEGLELDPEKREFPKDEAALKDLWRRIFKQSVLTHYMSLLDDQKEESKDNNNKKKSKKKKKKVAAKKMTKEEMIKTAVEAIGEKYKRVFERVLSEDHDDHIEKFINSIASIYDPHTSYLPPKRKEDFDIDISGSLEGIGAVLQEDGAFIKVVTVVPGGAAWRQKDLEVDDVILMVGQGEKEPVDLMNMRVDDAVRYIRGKKGTEVRLTVKKPDGTRKVIPIIRDVVQIGASFAKSSVLKLKGTGISVGYIYLPKFYRDFNGTIERNCSQDVKNEVEALKKHNVDAIILDLRNNAGGALEDARQMSGLFIEKGPIVQVRAHTGEVEVLADNDQTVTYDGPLIVMTNRFSASASEIVAAAMQDYKRAVIVGGEYSHGKGTVQGVYNLNQGPLLSILGPNMGALKVTIQKFYRVTGSSTQFKGVTPDIVLPDPTGYAKNREQDLDYALEWDKVAGKNFTAWNKFNYDLSTLRKRSEQRVGKNDRFKKIVESVDYMKKRQDETYVSLKLDDVLKEDATSEEMAKKLKSDFENKDLEVLYYEESLKSGEKVAKADRAKWKKDMEQMKEDWVTGLRKDTLLEETIFIADDIVKSLKGVTLSMIK